MKDSELSEGISHFTDNSDTNGQKPHILIVDDRAENILPLRKILEANDYLVDSATSGEAALKKILKHTYSLIILDVQMPVMDGYEVAETISNYRRAQNTPIIFLSAVNKDKEFITKGYQSGGIDYMTKPADPDILILKVRTFIKLFDHQQKMKIMQEALLHEIETRKEAQENLRMVLESLPQMAFTLNREGLIEYVNKHWFNYSTSASIFPKNHPDEESVNTNREAAFENGVEFKSELRLCRLDSEDYNYFVLKIMPVMQHGEIIRWVGTYSDIHQQKLANESLENTVALRTEELLVKNVQLETINHELQQFTWVVSHDLKEPLRKIQTFNNLVRQKYLSDNPEALLLIDRSIVSAARLSNLIGDLLDFSHLSAATNFVTTDLNALVQELLTEFEDVISEKRAVITVGALPIIDAVANQLRLVFQNLLSNSLKFARKGVGPAITITAELVNEKRISALASADGKFCRIIFKDNGIGFKEEYLSKIFIIFQQLNTDKEYEGTGIGLAIANKIIEKHNGLITARSVENEGTHFILILPVKQ